jgi:hypothetical protein
MLAGHGRSGGQLLVDNLFEGRASGRAPARRQHAIEAADELA